MNRQQRRKAERRGTYVDPETRTVATATGHAFRGPQRVADLPEKVPGRHRWILSCGYNVTATEAAAAHEGVTSVLMGPDRLVSFGIGCWDCESSYRAAATSPCPGEPRP